MGSTERGELVWGELVGGSRTQRQIRCDIPGVVHAIEQLRTGANQKITERLYRCANGLALAARRGGRLHPADDNTWELISMAPAGENGPLVQYGESVGFVSDEQLLQAVRRLAVWFDHDAVAVGA